MNPLLYRNDAPAVYGRLTKWWKGSLPNRPMLLLEAPREVPLEDLAPASPPDGWVTERPAEHIAWRMQDALAGCSSTVFLAEALPYATPAIAPDTLALFLGCRAALEAGHPEMLPSIHDPDHETVTCNLDNRHWRFVRMLAREMVMAGTRRYRVGLPSMAGGFDTLAALRGHDAALLDLVERPEWATAALAGITEGFFRCYDRLYELLRDESGGSLDDTGVWAPGRLCRISWPHGNELDPGLFREFLLPVLQDMTERTSFSIYTCSGNRPDRHLDTLLALPSLDAIEWQPDPTMPPPTDPVWWPVFKVAIEHGKRILLRYDDSTKNLAALQAASGDTFPWFAFRYHAPNITEAQTFLARINQA